MSEELIRLMGELNGKLDALETTMRTHHQQLDARIDGVERRMAELSGSVALVISRSGDNKKKLAGWQTGSRHSIGD